LASNANPDNQILMARHLKILTISNLYPPYGIGGYELACAEIVDAFRQRGHQITVLTSWRGLQRPKVEQSVLRLLRIRLWYESPFRNRGIELIWYLWNCLILKFVVWKIKPDVIHVFNPSGLGSFILDWLHSQDIPIIHDVFDSWLIEAYRSDIWFGMSLKSRRSLLKWFTKLILIRFASIFIDTVPTPIDLSRSYFRSRFLKQQFAEAGFKIGDSPVIYYGVRPSDFKPVYENRILDGIVFSGRLSPEKGIHVFLEALSLIKNFPHTQSMRVTIIGPITVSDYGQKLQNLAKNLEPHISVHFTGYLPRTEAIDLMRNHNIFVFPVLWDEPFGIALLEAMGLGLAVIATGTGGSAEILVDEMNCLIVAKGDPQALANAIERLIRDVSLRNRIANGGIKTIKNFDFDLNINLIEEHIQRIAYPK
jgi:glycosyltransferase involved in cell wall biosynthesis